MLKRKSFTIFKIKKTKTKTKVRSNLNYKIYTNKHIGNTLPTSGDNVSVNNPFDDPVGPSSRPSYQQGGGAPYSPVTRPQGTNKHTICRFVNFFDSNSKFKFLFFLLFSLSFSSPFLKAKLSFILYNQFCMRFFFFSFMHVMYYAEEVNMFNVQSII